MNKKTAIHLSTLFRKTGLYLLALLMVVSIMPVHNVLAEPAPLPPEDEAGISLEEFYRESDINFFGEDIGGACGTGAAGDSGPLVGEDNVRKAFEYFMQRGFTPQQAAGIIGNLMHESGMDPAIHQRSGGPGRGLAQWEVGGRFDQLEEFARSKGKPWQDLQVQLEFIMHEFNTTEKRAYREFLAVDKNDVNATTKAFLVHYERAGTPALDKRIGHANNVLKLIYGDGPVPTESRPGTQLPNADSGSPAVGGGAAPTAGVCPPTGTAGVVAGSIVETAVGLAWPTPRNIKEPTPAFQTAFDQHNGSVGQEPLTDCGVFVATVLHASGADTDYPKRGTGAQQPYVKGSPKFQKIDNVTTSAQLQPGDVLVAAGSPFGHTMIYVGPQAGGYPIAHASLFGHTPQLDEASNLQAMLRRSNETVGRMSTGTNPGADI